jgi:signal transduction histidine kinase
VRARFRSPRRLARFPGGAAAVREARHRFVTAVSHELRTPLAQIRLMSETLLLGRAGPGDATRWLQAIVREAQTLDDRIANVLHYAHADGAGAGIHHGDVDLAELAGEVGAAAAAVAAPRGASVRVVATEALVRGDRGALRLALVNLVENALRHGPAGQAVLLTVGAEDGRAELAVTDQGRGMGIRPGPGAGMGLGLTVVRRIATDHRGVLFVDTAPAGGNRVGLRLPLSAPVS